MLIVAWKPSSRLPLPAPRKPDDPEPNPEKVRQAQRMAGGLIWLSTRTRPDVAFMTSRIGMFATVDPEWSLRLGKRVLRYLVATRDFGLVYPFTTTSTNTSTTTRERQAPILWGDNAASLCIADGQGSWRTRSLANQAVALRSRLDQGTLELKKVASDDQRADGLTKAFSASAMTRIRSHFGLVTIQDLQAIDIMP